MVISFATFFLKLGITEAIIKPIAMRFILWSMQKYTPEIYRKLDSADFLASVVSGDKQNAKNRVEAAIASELGHVPTALETAAVITGYDPLAAAANVAKEGIKTTEQVVELISAFKSIKNSI